MQFNTLRGSYKREPLLLLLSPDHLKKVGGCISRATQIGSNGTHAGPPIGPLIVVISDVSPSTWPDWPAEVD